MHISGLLSYPTRMIKKTYRNFSRPRNSAIGETFRNYLQTQKMPFRQKALVFNQFSLMHGVTNHVSISLKNVASLFCLNKTIRGVRGWHSIMI